MPIAGLGGTDYRSVMEFINQDKNAPGGARQGALVVIQGVPYSVNTGDRTVWPCDYEGNRLELGAEENQNARELQRYYFQFEAQQPGGAEGGVALPDMQGSQRAAVATPPEAEDTATQALGALQDLPRVSHNNTFELVLSWRQNPLLRDGTECVLYIDRHPFWIVCDENGRRCVHPLRSHPETDGFTLILFRDRPPGLTALQQEIGYVLNS